MVEIPQDIDEKRIDGLNAPSAVAFVVGKDAKDLEEIEELHDGRAAFHKNAQGTGFYFVDTESWRCSCPSFKFKTALIEGQCKHLRAVARKQDIKARNGERAIRRAAEPEIDIKAKLAAPW